MAFIRRKSKGSTYYYELVENSWVGGKVVQRIIEYFPTLEAANLFCEKKGIRKFETKYLISPEFETQLADKLEKLNKRRPLPESSLKNLRVKFEVDMTYNSNAIEGNRLTLRETALVIRKGMTIGGKSLQEHLEAKNHVEALGLLYELVAEKRAITEDDILQLHKIVLEKIDKQYAGKYRDRAVYIEGVVHVPPPAKNIPKLMRTVMLEANNKEQGVKAIISASRLHHLIASIHPFIDGNGRMARLLLNLRLMRAGFPPTVLRKNERKSYYSSLEKADDGDFFPITTLIARDVEQALDLWLEATA